MALPTKLLLEIVTPDRSLVHEEVDEVQLPGAEGYLGVLPGHTPLLATLGVGELWYRVEQETHYLAIASGFGEVLPDSVTVLAQIAERAQDIDVGRAEAARKRAEERLNKNVDADIDRARIALMKSLIRIQVASRARTKV
ncbi:MAG: F0F1 ATP synthase subunit epsilon [Acidobacteria bacterium]|nr:F0F1 ATP synthase subunit epsilon [Acidobacteriota bacterium]